MTWFVKLLDLVCRSWWHIDDNFGVSAVTAAFCTMVSFSKPSSWRSWPSTALNQKSIFHLLSSQFSLQKKHQPESMTWITESLWVSLHPRKRTREVSRLPLTSNSLLMLVLQETISSKLMVFDARETTNAMLTAKKHTKGKRKMKWIPLRLARFIGCQSAWEPIQVSHKLSRQNANLRVGLLVETGLQCLHLDPDITLVCVDLHSNHPSLSKKIEQRYAKIIILQIHVHLFYHPF